MRHHLPFLAIPLLLSGCLDTDTSPFVVAKFLTATIQVSNGALGSTVAGDLGVNFHLGHLAENLSHVDLLLLEIYDEKGSATLFPIEAGLSIPRFPIIAEVDTDLLVTIPYTHDQGTILTPEERVKLCKKEGVVFRITFQDSRLQTTTSLFSQKFHPKGCV